MEIIPEDRGQHAHSSRLEYIITTSILDTSMDGRSTHTDADEEIFNIPSTRRMELLGILSQTIGHVDVPVPFWATLIQADIDMLEKFVEEAQKSVYLSISACMHAQLYLSSGGRRSRDYGPYRSR